MLSCTQFIPSYSELFKFIEERAGYAGVLQYWEHISDNYVAPRLGKCVREHGLAGCYEYWSHSLNEEAADFTMRLDEENGSFSIEMHQCPSKGGLLKLHHMEPYPHYCSHCDTLYRRVLEPFGFRYEFDASGCGHASCAIRVFAK